MRTALRAAAALFAAFGLCAPPAEASTLAVDGATSVVKIVGQSLAVTITGKAGAPATLLLDISPGPVDLLGQTLPLGFSFFVQAVPLGAIPASGTLAFSATVPNLAALADQQVFLLAVVADSAAPLGLDFSNGADVTFHAPPGVGAAQATLVGRTVVLDGADAAGPSGDLLPGYTISWSLLATPAGSGVAIEDPTRPFATLTPDRPGDYLVAATIGTPGGVFSAQTTVHAWRVVTQPLGDGGVTNLAALDLSGTISGAPAAATLDGQPLALNGLGQFGPVNVAFAPGAVTRTLEFRLAHADGTVARHRMTLFKGVPANVAAAYPKPLAAQLNASGLAKVADEGEVLLQAADIKSLLLAAPPEQVANDTGPFGITLFSATIDFKNLTYDPNIQLALVPTASGIVGTVTIHNVKAFFDVYGEVFDIDYDLDGDLTTSPTIITATLVGSAQNGQLHVAVSNVSVDRQNFAFNLNGFLGSVAELFVIESAVKEDVEAAIAATVQQQLGPAVEEVLGALVLEGSLLDTLLVDVTIGAPVAALVHSNFGLTIQLDGKATVGVPEPGSPAVPQFRSSPSTPPTFAATAPGGGGYDAGLSVSDDFINLVLAASTAAGMLDGDLSSLIPRDGSVPLAFTAGDLALLFQGTGFEEFAPATVVKLRAHGTAAPTLVLHAGQPSLGTVYFQNLEVEFEVAASYGMLPLLRVALDATADVNLATGNGGTLSATLVSSTLAVHALRAFPGADPAAVEQQAQFLEIILNFAVPQLIEAFGSIPLPSLAASGLALDPTQVALFGPGNTFLGFFGQLLLLP